MAVRRFARVHNAGPAHPHANAGSAPGSLPPPADAPRGRVDWAGVPLAPRTWPRPSWQRTTLRGSLLLMAAAGAVAAGAVLRDAWLTPGTVATLEKLGSAALVGLVLTAVQRHISSNRTAGRPLERAQVLLAVAGALTMILVDNSVARAFGVAGAASIVRFRTPVDDPADSTVLFLSMGLGMCSGVGAFGLAVIGALVVGLLLEVMTTRGATAPRQTVTIELVSSGHGFQTSQVGGVFARHGVQAELAEWKQHGEVRARYRALADQSLCFEDLGRDLQACPGVGSVSCEGRKPAG